MDVRRMHVRFTRFEAKSVFAFLAMTCMGIFFSFHRRMQARAARAVRAAAVLAAVLGVCAPGVAEAACPVELRPSPPLELAPQAAQRVRTGQVLRILAIGSSSTTGVGASSPQATYPAQLARLLVEALGEGRVEITNAGVSGESAPSTVKRLEVFLAEAEKPDVVLWQVGTNDVIFGGSPERLGALVRQGLAATAAAGVATVVIDQQYFPLILDVGKYERFVAAVGAAAAEGPVPLLSRYAMMKQWSLEDPAGFKGLFSWDRFHMNDNGYACLAAQLAGAIDTAVGVAKAQPASSSTAVAGEAALPRGVR